MEALLQAVIDQIEAIPEQQRTELEANALSEAIFLRDLPGLADEFNVTVVPLEAQQESDGG